jgi:hypothetical protein
LLWETKNRQTAFPAARSRVVIRLAQGRKAKPNANTRTLRPDKCLVVSSLSPGLRPGCPRNTGDNAVTTRAGLAPFRHFYPDYPHRDFLAAEPFPEG